VTPIDTSSFTNAKPFDVAELQALALWALDGGRYWLGYTIRRGVGERVTCHAKSIWSMPQIETVDGSEHADPWESLKLAKAISDAALADSAPKVACDAGKPL
jgi:Cft2 family RNA processing exonuclease